MKVLDSSAVLAVLYGETGSASAVAALPGGRASLVNVAEIVGDLLAAGAPSVATAEQAVRALGLVWCVPDERQALAAAALKPFKGLSLGDRFCLALAQSLGTAAVTADQAWANLTLPVKIELIR